MSNFHDLVKTAADTGDKDSFKTAYNEASTAVKKLIETVVDNSYKFIFDANKIGEACADHWARENSGFSYHIDYIANTIRKDFFVDVDVEDLDEVWLSKKQDYLCRLLSAVPHNSFETLKLILAKFGEHFSAADIPSESDDESEPKQPQEQKQEQPQEQEPEQALEPKQEPEQEQPKQKGGSAKKSRKKK